MLDPDLEKDEKLKEVRSLFQESIDHDDEASVLWHEDARFYLNSCGSGQWTQEDLEYLRKQNRPAFTFNLMAGKIDTFIGMQKDAKRRAIATPVGGEDNILADVLNSLLDRVYEHSGISAAEDICLQYGAVMGPGTLAIDARTDSKDPSQIEITVDAIKPYEVHWDPGAEKPDRSDANYVFWSRWLTRSEFVAEYPEHKDDFDALKGGQNTLGDPYANPLRGIDSERRGHRAHDYEDRVSWGTYWDDDEQRIRVIRCEYKVPVQDWFAVHTSGKSERIDKSALDTFRQFQATGLSDMDLTSVWSEQVYAMEFVGTSILWESHIDEDGEKAKGGNRTLPITGFSLVPFSFYWDWEEHQAYGMARNLKDPQKETNKSYTQGVELLAAQAKPGLIAEESAIDDVTAVEQSLRRGGGVTIVNDGALTGGKLLPVTPPVLSPGAADRLRQSVEMMDKVSGIYTDALPPSAQAEAAATVQLRHHKSKLAHAGPIERFEATQKTVARKIVELIIHSMDDEQIEEMLGNEARYVVQDGVVFDLENIDPRTGQPVGASLKGLEDLRYDIDLQVASMNSTLRVMELQMWMEAMAAGVPIPADMIAEHLSTNRSTRERLKKYGEEQAQMASQQAEREAQTLEGQVQATIGIEAQKAAEQSRHNQAGEALDRAKLQSDTTTTWASILEKADATEKKHLTTLMEAAVKAQQAQRQA